MRLRINEVKVNLGRFYIFLKFLEKYNKIFIFCLVVRKNDIKLF